MKTLLLAGTYLVGIGALILSGYFWSTNQKDEIRRVMSFLALAAGTWVISSGLTAYRAPSFLVEVNIHVVYISGVFLVTALLHLAILFPYKIFSFDRLHTLLLYLPALLFSIIELVTKGIVQSFRVSPNDAGVVIPGSIFPLYNGYLSILFVLTLLLLVKKYNKTDGISRRLTLLVFWSILIGGLPAVLIDLVIPLFSTIYINSLVGNIFTAVWIGITAYIIRSK